jgi:hypothetical protein
VDVRSQQQAVIQAVLPAFSDRADVCSLEYRRNRALTAIDFIGNHRSFLLKPRTLLALGAGGQPGTEKVLRAMRMGDFGLPPGCSATYDVSIVDALSAITRVGARSALEDYCRSYADERGYRPSAVQVYEAGYNPASVRARHAHWFGFLDDLELLGDHEREVVRRHADVLAGFEKEPITKSYKRRDEWQYLHDCSAAISNGESHDYDVLYEPVYLPVLGISIGT